jgi:hypothetical protein
MSYRKFKASNMTKKSRTLFNERGKYNNEGIPLLYRERYPGLFRNFWFIENMYYGRIDRAHKFILLKPEKLVPANGEQGSSIYLVDFAAHALGDFLREHQKAFSSSKIQKNDDFLSELNPHKGHRRLLTDYDLYITSLRNEIHPKMTRQHNSIKDFDDFINFFLNEIYSKDQITPITLTGFVASRFSSPMSSGLFVDLVELDPGDDTLKVSSIIDRPNFEFLMNNAVKHGFMIDYNIPTRLCANLGSGEMEKYMDLYGINSSNIFDNYYDHVYTLDHRYFMNYMRKFYNKFVGLRPNLRKEKTLDSKNNKIHRYLIKKQKISQYTLDKVYDEKYRINLYVDLRNYESNNRYSDSLLEKLKENATEYLKIEGLDRALEYIDYQFVGFLNDPYGYNGFVLKEEAKKNNEQMSGQDLQELLNDSVTDSRKTFY